MYAKIAVLSTAAALAAVCFGNPADVRTSDKRDVEQAAARFYSSLNAIFTGDTTPMQQIWSHADDITYLGPTGGIETGWAQVSAIWTRQAALNLGGSVEPTAMQITVGGDLAVVQCLEQGHNLDTQGRPVPVSIRATSVFRNEQGEWKMISHHTDLIPELEQRAIRLSTTEVGN